MPIASAGSDYNNLLTTTAEKLVRSKKDNIFDRIPFFDRLNKRGRVKKDGGGESIMYITEYGQNDNELSYSGTDLLRTDQHEFLMRAFYNYRSYAINITITGDDKDKNASDPTKLLDLLDAKISNAEKSLADKLNRHAFAAGTGNDSKDILGLQAIVADTPTTGTTGNINCATYTWWRNQYTNTAGSFASGGGAFMRDLYHDCMRTGEPTVLVTTQVIFEYYEGTLIPQVRYTDVKEANSGFTSLTYKGKPIFFDRDCGSGRMYMLNEDELDLWILNGKDFTMGPFITPPDQDVSIAQLYFKGQLATGERRAHGVITGITA